MEAHALSRRHLFALFNAHAAIGLHPHHPAQFKTASIAGRRSRSSDHALGRYFHLRRFQLNRSGKDLDRAIEIELVGRGRFLQTDAVRQHNGLGTERSLSAEPQATRFQQNHLGPTGRRTAFDHDLASAALYTLPRYVSTRHLNRRPTLKHDPPVIE
jgi:hypothetical protein